MRYRDEDDVKIEMMRYRWDDASDDGLSMRHRATTTTTAAECDDDGDQSTMMSIQLTT